LDQTNPISVTIEDESIDDSDASIVSAESDYSSDEEEADEFLAERRMILEEARELREVAEYYHHPEAPVASHFATCTRCIFSRYSAPTSDELEIGEEREQILADAKNLKELAECYMHPEKPVVSSDATASGRNYFTRPSAPEYEDDDDMEEERERILEEMKQLKATAEWYLNPDKPIEVDPAACGRNYFSRPSAPVNENEEERDLILNEMKELKTFAEWHMHPEAPVVSDAAACARNFFSRPSAAISEDEAERELVLEEMKQLKTTADWYMHPEKPVAVNSAAYGRNFFARPSAPEYEEDADERDRILQEMKELKTVAEWYMHPEKPVSVDAAACGRNYFSRPSAPDFAEEDEERERILEEMNDLKTTAEWYMHPEKPVSVDATACGRNYFSRPSAPGFDEEDMEERQQILEEMKELKTTAEWYMHPEKPISVDAAACGRNYFNRPSAPECDEEDMEERQQILEDMKELKTVADWYMHPEKPVAVDAKASARNFFTRPSASEEDVSMDEEREQILEEMKELKKTAEWYLHPEKPVAVDSTACGRNFFSRHSAFDDDAGCVSWEDDAKEQHLSLDFESSYSEEMEEERKLVLAEANQLKQVASWYLQPEKPIEVDPASFGRNFFSRISAQEQDDPEDMEQRELILAEAYELKMVADWYRNPEKEVTVYATAYGRNYFTRPSAPIEDEEEERQEILADVAELLRVAEWHMYPEKPVTVYATSTGRNFFSRPSAPMEEDYNEVEEERLRILEEAQQLREIAGWYANPEQPVKSDGFAMARNYFSRPSAPEYDEDAEERDRVLAEAKDLKEVAGWYANPEQPVRSDGFATARSYFNRPSAPEVEEDAEERGQILAEAGKLKEVATWYLHPEKPIDVDSTAFGRNYFSRPSAEQEENEEERALILADGAELKKLAVDYLHPEKPVASSTANCARNYFDRPSATSHADHIHTEGYINDPVLHGDYVQHDFNFHHADYDQNDHPHHHDCDVSQQSFHSHGDHFDMDEDLHGFRESITAFRDSVAGIHDPQHIPIIKEDDGKEVNLSRSPSSILLFDEQAAV
jgi:hypothetical protein